jgi:arginine:agmatine antiporter
VTLAAIWLAVGVSWIGPRAVARIEGLTLAIGLLPVLVAATFGWFAFHPATFAASWNPQGLGLTSAVGSSALTAFWAFLGVECAAAAAGVVRNPTRNVPRATLIGVIATAFVYISACTVLMGILPAADLAKSPAPFAGAGKASLGLGLAALIAVCALLRARVARRAGPWSPSETTRTPPTPASFRASSAPALASAPRRSSCSPPAR